MSIETIKSSLALPEAGQIRKGAAKGKDRPGRDLGAKFRVIFFEGEDNQASKKRFLEVHKDHVSFDERNDIILDPAELVIMFPFADPVQCWDPFYEAYTAGRMVARADGVRFVRWIDTKTGNVIVGNGEKFIPFTPGMSVGTYTNDKGHEVEIRAKAVGRLRIVLPELVRFATLTVHTTSIYDVVRLTQQIDGLKYLASLLPRNNGVAGIPLTLTRRWTTITWSKADGSAQRVKYALLNIEADPDWVQKMFKRMGDLALPTGKANALLPAGEEVDLDIPSADQDQAQSEADGYTDEEGGEDHPESGPAPATASTAVVINPTAKDPAPAVSPAQTVSSAPAAVPANGNGSNPNSNQQSNRPYNAETVVQKLAEIAAKNQEKINAGKINKKPDRDDGNKLVYVTQMDRNMIAANLELCFVGEKYPDKIRHSVLKFLCNQVSVSDLSDCQVMALRAWLNATKDSGGAWAPDKLAVSEAQNVWREALKANGQTEFPTDNPDYEGEIPEMFR